MSDQILVLGIGNTLMRDDGAGPQVVALLRDGPLPATGVRLLDGGTLSFTLLHILCAHPALIVVDAVQLGMEPGAIERFEGAAMDVHLRCGKCSAHEVGIAELLDMARLLDALPARRMLIAIQAASLSLGEGLSVPVSQAIPRAAEAVRETVGQWMHTPTYLS